MLLVESTVRHSFMPMGLDSSAWFKMREVWEEGGIYMYMYVQVSIQLEPEDVSLLERCLTLEGSMYRIQWS